MVCAAYFPVGWVVVQKVVAAEAADPIAVAVEAHPIVGFAADTVEDTEHQSTGLGLAVDSPVEVEGSLEVVDNLADVVDPDSPGPDSLAGDGRRTMGP